MLVTDAAALEEGAAGATAAALLEFVRTDAGEPILRCGWRQGGGDLVV